MRERVIKIKGKGDGAHKIKERIIPFTVPIVLLAVKIYLKLRLVSIFPHLFLSHRLEPLNIKTEDINWVDFSIKIFGKGSKERVIFLIE